MNVQDLKELMETMALTGVSKFEWQNCNGKVRLERQTNVITSQEFSEPLQSSTNADPEIEKTQNMALVASQQAQETGEAAPAQGQEAVQERTEEVGELVESPVVGVFYSAPSPDSEPFVRKGSRVEKGDPLCIIEAMKLMNEVDSPFSGEILEILVENGQKVEFGQALFRIV